jgi:hypothetical protein
MVRRKHLAKNGSIVDASVICATVTHVATARRAVNLKMPK